MSYERLKRLRLVGSAAAGLSLAPNLAVAQQAARESASLIVDVAFTGIESVERDELEQGLVTRATRCRTLIYTPICLVSRSPVFAKREYLDRQELQKDLLRIRLYYWRRGFRDTRVTARQELKDGGLKITFAVVENEPTRVDSVEVVQTGEVLPENEVKSSLHLKRGEPLNVIALDSTVMLLRDALWERGYSDAEVRADTSRVSDGANHGPVSIHVEPGHIAVVDTVVLRGNSAISRRTVQRLMHLKRGDVYRRSAVLNSQRDLYLSGLFSEVDLRAEPVRDSGKVLHVDVVEAPLRRADLASGITSADFVQLDAQFVNYHFLGSARKLTIRSTVSNLLAKQLNAATPFYDVTQGAVGPDRDPFLQPTWSLSASLVQPWAFGPDNQLGISIYTHRRSVPGIVTDRGAGASTALTRQLGSSANATLGYTWEASSIEASDVYFCVSIGLCVQSAIDVVARRNALAPLSFVAQRDGSDDPLKPTTGSRVRFDVEYASQGTGSRFDYTRGAFSASVYRKVLHRSVIAGRVRFGAVRALAGTNAALGLPAGSDPVIHPRKLFFSGGSQSVRGYGENQLGPRILTIDPARLTDTTLAVPCTQLQLADGSCDPNREGLRSADFQPRPLGGTALAEASVELRFPISRSIGIEGAVFVDGAVVGTKRFSDLLGATAAVTPGFGVRFDTPAGPVRLDLGIRPRVVERLPVVTQVTNADGSLTLVDLKTARRFNQAEAQGGFLGQLFSRLTLHLAIGPAF